MNVDIVLPVLNEEKSLEKSVLTIRAYLDENLENHSYSLVIADNGSADETESIGRRLAANDSKVRYIRLPKPGVGAALQKAWSDSQADLVGYMDLDLATDLVHVQQALDALADGAALVYGSRLHPDSSVKGRTLARSAISRCFNLVLKFYLNVRFSDGMCGFKFLRLSVLPELLAGGAKSEGWFFSTELLVVAERLGLPIYELPVHWTDDPDSRVKVAKLTLQYLKGMHDLRKQA